MSEVSILIPTYNRLHTLKKVIASAFAEEAVSLEVVVCDDGSTDGTREYLTETAAREPRLRYFANEKNLGMVGNWNRCLAEARSPWVKLLCDDDELIPGALAAELAVAKGQLGIAFVAGLSLEVAESDFSKANDERLRIAHRVGVSRVGRWTRAELCKRMVLEENLIGPPPAVLFKREFIPQFDPKITYATDWAAWISLLERGDALTTGQPSCFFRLHAQNLTKRFVLDGTELVEVFQLRLRSLAVYERERGRDYDKRLLLGLHFAYRILRRLVKLSLSLRFKEIPLVLGRLPEVFKPTHS